MIIDKKTTIQKCNGTLKYILRIIIEYLEINQLLVLDSPLGVDMPLNKPNQTIELFKKLFP